MTDAGPETPGHPPATRENLEMIKRRRSRRWRIARWGMILASLMAAGFTGERWLALLRSLPVPEQPWGSVVAMAGLSIGLYAAARVGQQMAERE